MYDHIGLKVADLDASVRFYTAALRSLGHVPGSHDESYAGFGPPEHFAKMQRDEYAELAALIKQVGMKVQ